MTTSPDRIERAIRAALQLLYGDGEGGYGPAARKVAERHVRLHIAIALALTSEPPIEDAEADAAVEVLAQRIKGEVA